MGSSSVERGRCRWGFLSLRRRCKSDFQYLLIDLIFQGKDAWYHGGSCQANDLGA
jgi:hypothetical protein